VIYMARTFSLQEHTAQGKRLGNGVKMKKWIFAIGFIVITSLTAGCVAVAQTPSTPPPTSRPVPTSVPNSPTNEPTNLPIATATSFPILTVTIPPGTPMPPDSTQAKLIADAKADLVTRANVSADAIRVVSIEPAEWHDASLGCPKIGVFYIQVITPGYKIILEAQGKQYEYHTGDSRVVYCEPH
jgi:hypothetical protein